MEKFAQLPGILVARASEDVMTLTKGAATYVLKCYYYCDPSFYLKTVREGVMLVSPPTMERPEAECQGSVNFIGSIFQVETIEEVVEEE